MRRQPLTIVLTAFAVAVLVLPAASVAATANDTQLKAALCTWSHSNTSQTQRLRTMKKFDAHDRAAIAAYAREILSDDATLRRVFQRTSPSSAVGRQVKSNMLTNVLPGVDAGARLVIQGSKLSSANAAAKAIGTGLGKLFLASFQVLKPPGIYKWAPAGCFASS